jgi:hypothetical protein
MPRLTPMVALVPLAASALAAPPSVDYPTGYRKWVHVKSMAIVSDNNPLYASFGGIHHIYANPPVPFWNGFITPPTPPKGPPMIQTAP